MLDELHKVLSESTRRRVLVVGDLILDEYVDGSIERISPEAPVPVVDSASTRQVLGGAANVAHNLAALGCDVRIVGVVGEDEAAKSLRAQLEAVGIDASGLVVSATRPTTHKVRIVAHGQQLLRLDRETRSALDVATRGALLRAFEAALADVDGVVFSDYHKGVLARGAIEPLLDAAVAAQKLVVVDPKGRDYGRYRGARALTPNLRELELATGMPVDTSDAIAAAASTLRTTSGVPVLLVTAGADGMWLFGASGDPVHIRTEAREVFDVTGAGDTVVALFGLALFAGVGYADAARIANAAAGIVVGKLGTATVSRKELLARVAGEEASWERKLLSASEAAAFAEEARRRGKRVVFTNGCFDLLHAGHVSYLQKARSFGDLLVIGLNDDGSVRTLKGEKRPLVAERERAQLLCALEAVDAVVLFGEETPEELIRAVRPDVLVKGADYRPEEVAGRTFVESQGGRLELVPLVAGRSTSGLIERIVDAYGKKE